MQKRNTQFPTIVERQKHPIKQYVIFRVKKKTWQKHMAKTNPQMKMYDF